MTGLSDPVNVILLPETKVKHYRTNNKHFTIVPTAGAALAVP